MREYDRDETGRIEFQDFMDISNNPQQFNDLI